jgi:protoporphyrinogen oxidase
MPVIRVAVVGSGIGAASTCYFLNKMFKDSQQSDQIHIEVFESASHVGGRSEAVKIGERNMEIGAGIAYTVLIS